MKIMIKGQPEFRFALTMEQIHVLLELARGHYDHECRKLADSAGAIGKAMSLAVEIGQHCVHTFSSRDLDLLCKVLEASSCMTGEKYALASWMHQYLRAALVAGRNAAASWEIML